MNVLKIALAQHNIDPRRIYLLGHSMGGGGALYLGIKYSDIWAAVGATAPAPGSARPGDLEKVRQLPFIIVHGDADPAVPVQYSRNWADKFKELGMTYEYRELRGAGHEEAIFQGARYVFDFFDQHPRPAVAAR
jgi:predicted esterase